MFSYERRSLVEVSLAKGNFYFALEEFLLVSLPSAELIFRRFFSTCLTHSSVSEAALLCLMENRQLVESDTWIKPPM